MAYKSTATLQDGKMTVNLFPSWFETCGDNSLEGLMGADLYKTDKIVLIVHNSPMWHRAESGGPELIVIPEFSIPCFLSSILNIQNRGFAVTLQMIYDWMPQKEMQRG